VIVEKTPLEGLLLIKPNVHEDKRGYFYENYRDELFEANGYQLISVRITRQNPLRVL